MPLLRSTLVYALTNIVGSAIPLLILPILTRALTPEDYGTVTVFSIAIAVLGALTGLSVHGAVGIRYFERDKVDLPRYVGACLLILMTSTALVLLAGALVLPSIDVPRGLPIPWLALATVVSAAQFVTLIRLSLCQSAGRVWQFGGLRICQATLDAGISLLLVLAFGMAWQGRVLGIAIAAIVTAAVALHVMARERGIQFGGSTEYVGDAVRFGVPLVFHVLGGLLITTGDKMIVAGMLSLDELGQYAVAAQVAAVLSVLYDAAFKAFQPWVIEHAMVVEQRRHVVVSSYKLLIGTTVAGIAYLAVAAVAYPWLVGDRYKAGRSLLLPLVIAAMVRCGYFATAIFINIAGKNGHLARNSVLSGATGVVAAVLLIPHIGVLGAAWGVVIAEVCSLVLNLRSSIAVYPMPWTLR